MPRNLTITSGQLGATAATLLAGSAAPESGRIDLVCHNTSSDEQTVVLTFQVAGGTARRLWRGVLQENEQLLATGIPIAPDDTLLAVTTSASSVDYLIFASKVGAMSFDVLSADGTSKGVAVLRKILLGMEFLADGSLVDPG